MDIAEFLEARFAEDEAVARTPNLARVAADNWIAATDVGGGPAILVDPDRLLADVAAKRRIVELAVSEVSRLDDVFESEAGPGDDRVSDELLKMLALPYSEHEDYREEWRI